MVEFDVMKAIADYGIMAGLFIWSFYNMQKDRERLMNQLEKSQETLQQFGSKYDLVIERLDDLQNLIHRDK